MRRSFKEAAIGAILLGALAGGYKYYNDNYNGRPEKVPPVTNETRSQTGNRATPDEVINAGERALSLFGGRSLPRFFVVRSGLLPDEILPLLEPAMADGWLSPSEALLTFAAGGSKLDSIRPDPAHVRRTAGILKSNGIADPDGRHAEGLARYATHAARTMDPALFRSEPEGNNKAIPPPGFGSSTVRPGLYYQRENFSPR